MTSPPLSLPPSLPVPSPIPRQSRLVQTHAESQSTSRWLLIKKISREPLPFICSAPRSQNHCGSPVLINRGHVHTGRAPFHQALTRGNQHRSRARGPQEAIPQCGHLWMAFTQPLRSHSLPAQEAGSKSKEAETREGMDAGRARTGQASAQPFPPRSVSMTGWAERSCHLTFPNGAEECQVTCPRSCVIIYRQNLLGLP